MTQPTQAQIEAAIKAYANINGINGTRHYSALLAALTAAAEVERPRRGFSSPGFEQGMQSEWDAQLAKARAEMKERCAQVAQNWMIEGGSPQIGKLIADAIRTMDK